MAKGKTLAETAMGMLATREHSLAELRRKLQSKGYPKAEVESTLERLAHQGAQSDSRYAAARARYRATVSKWGWSKIALELRAQGVDGADISAAKECLAEEGVVFAEMAKKAARPDADRQKALARLLRRGYSMDEAKAALDETSAGE